MAKNLRKEIFINKLILLTQKQCLATSSKAKKSSKNTEKSLDSKELQK